MTTNEPAPDAEGAPAAPRRTTPRSRSTAASKAAAAKAEQGDATPADGAPAPRAARAPRSTASRTRKPAATGDEAPAKPSSPTRKTSRGSAATSRSTGGAARGAGSASTSSTSRAKGAGSRSAATSPRTRKPVSRAYAPAPSTVAADAPAKTEPTAPETPAEAVETEPPAGVVETETPAEVEVTEPQAESATEVPAESATEVPAEIATEAPAEIASEAPDDEATAEAVTDAPGDDVIADATVIPEEEIRVDPLVSADDRGEDSPVTEDAPVIESAVEPSIDMPQSDVPTTSVRFVTESETVEVDSPTPAADAAAEDAADSIAAEAELDEPVLERELVLDPSAHVADAVLQSVLTPDADPEDLPAVALTIRGLSKSFGSVKAVRDVDLTVHAGMFFGIVGPNGAGKTTTLSMITGLLRPDAGSIEVGGVEVWAARRARTDGMGVLPDRLRLFDRLTGAQLLHYAGSLRGLDRGTIAQRSRDLAIAFGLTSSLGRLVSDYSVGMTKKIALAAAMIHAPRLLVLDEPFESVDPVSTAAIIRILRRFAAAGGTVVLSSHSMDLIERVCDEVAIIAEGSVLASGSMRDVLGGMSLEDRFVELAGGAGAVEGMEWLQSF